MGTKLPQHATRAYEDETGLLLFDGAIQQVYEHACNRRANTPEAVAHCISVCPANSPDGMWSSVAVGHLLEDVGYTVFDHTDSAVWTAEYSDEPITMDELRALVQVR